MRRRWLPQARSSALTRQHPKLFRFAGVRIAAITAIVGVTRIADIITAGLAVAVTTVVIDGITVS
jgi:hypothetical protein